MPGESDMMLSVRSKLHVRSSCLKYRETGRRRDHETESRSGGGNHLKVPCKSRSLSQFYVTLGDNISLVIPATRSTERAPKKAWKKESRRPGRVQQQKAKKRELESLEGVSPRGESISGAKWTSWKKVT